MFSALIVLEGNSYGENLQRQDAKTPGRQEKLCRQGDKGLDFPCDFAPLRLCVEEFGWILPPLELGD
jgi:hypothetical protein